MKNISRFLVSLLFISAAVLPFSASAAVKPFIGVPTTYEQLYRCPIVGNNTSKIYHLKGSKYIKEMTVAKKKCFATEKDAQKVGYRKSKI